MWCEQQESWALRHPQLLLLVSGPTHLANVATQPQMYKACGLVLNCDETCWAWLLALVVL